MVLCKTLPLDQAAAGCVRPVLGLEPTLGGGGKQVKRSRKHQHFCSLSATLIQNALWKEHFEHHFSYTCQPSTVWDPIVLQVVFPFSFGVKLNTVPSVE